MNFSNLSLNSHHLKPWYFFDADFYLTQCIDAGIFLPLGTPDQYLQHFVDRGSTLGLSPNPLFDEDYYRRRHPSVARGIEMGTWISAFDHYCAVGIKTDFSPIWFFDAVFYRNRHPDLTPENLKIGGFNDIYSHYLLVGLGEKRVGHWTLQALMNIAPQFRFPSNAKDLAATITGGAKLPEIFMPVFDFAWMKEKYSWGTSVPPGRFMRHYLLQVRDLKLSPSPYFDEPFYLNDPEVMAAVNNGVFSCGYEHFTQQGLNEWRRPFAGFDPQFYFQKNMAKAGGQVGIRLTAPPFTHFLANRHAKRLEIAPRLSEMEIPEAMGKALYERRCALNAENLGPLQFCPPNAMPDVSILVVARDSFEETANCIVSAVYNTKARIEVVLFDNASTDDVRNIPTINPRIKYLRSEENLGFTVAVNRCAQAATGRMLLLLNNDAEVTPGAIDIALETLDGEPTIGAVGAKIVRMHGRLQEAASIIWRDGACLGYGRDRDPREGQVNFRQDVDFCSGCFLAVLKSNWEKLGGFDEAYSPAYYEETDFCVRLWEHGLRVVYEPRIVLWHFEFGTSSIREEPLALMRRNQRYFAAKNRAFLAQCFPPSPKNVERARLRHVRHPRTLFVEDMVPDPRRGMGYPRSAAIAQALAEPCGLVSLLGLHNTEWPRPPRGDGQLPQMEILTGVNALNLEEFFQSRIGVYDFLWLSRTHNLSYLRRLHESCPEFFRGVRVILDTEAVAATRKFAYANQTGRQPVLADLMLEEFEYLEGVDHICAVNEVDRLLLQEMLNQRGLAIPVSRLGYALRLTPKLPTFEQTNDIVLVGAYSQPDGPNADALLWFDKSVRPLLPKMPGLRFVIAGSHADKFARNAGLKHEYHILSDVPDMSAVYRTARIMVAPTRFAAGIPLKVKEAAGHGVPVVMTELLARQLGWHEDGLAISPAIPEVFAAAIAGVAMSQHAWERCQSIQARLIAVDCEPAAFAAEIHRIVGSFCPS